MNNVALVILFFEVVGFVLIGNIAYRYAMGILRSEVDVKDPHIILARKRANSITFALFLLLISSVALFGKMGYI